MLTMLLYSNMKVIVFDTETTGLPTERNASYMETDKWPHIVQFSWIQYDTEKHKLLHAANHIIALPDDVKISEESQAIHGISPGRCRRQGVPINSTLKDFGECLRSSDLAVAHNISFDKRVILAACRRERVPQYFFGDGKSIPEYCTMQRTKDFPVVVAKNKKGEEYNKYPTLTELHKYLFAGSSPRGMHDALADILICLRCYMKLCHDHDVVTDKGAWPNLYYDYAF